MREGERGREGEKVSMCFLHRHGIFCSFLAVLPLQSENLSLAGNGQKLDFSGVTSMCWLQIESPLFDLILAKFSIESSNFR